MTSSWKSDRNCVCCRHKKLDIRSRQHNSRNNKLTNMYADHYDNIKMTTNQNVITMTSHERHVVWNHMSVDCLFNSLCGPTSKTHQSPHYWPFEKASIWWRHHGPTNLNSERTSVSVVSRSANFSNILSLYSWTKQAPTRDCALLRCVIDKSELNHFCNVLEVM